MYDTMKKFLLFICLLVIGLGNLSAQEPTKKSCSVNDYSAHQQKLHQETVPSLRSLALIQATKVLHNELLQKPFLSQRLMVVEEWKQKIGIVFEPAYSSSSQQQSLETIVDCYENNYISRLIEIGQCPNLIEGLSNDGKKAFYKKLNDLIVAVDTENLQNLYTLKGHTNQINCVEVSPDNTKIATGSVDKTIKIWDLATGSLLYTLTGHDFSVTRLVFSNNSHVLVSYGQQSENFFNLSSYRHENRLKEQIVWDLLAGTKVEKITDTKAIVNYTGKYSYITKNYWFGKKKKIHNFKVPGTDKTAYELKNEHTTICIKNGIVAIGKTIYKDQGFMAAVEDMPQPQQHLPLLHVDPLLPFNKALLVKNTIEVWKKRITQ